MKRLILLCLFVVLGAALMPTYSQGAGPAITISTPFTDVCFNNPFTFTATVSNAGTAPVYQWQVNGSNVGTNSPTYSVTNMQEGSVIRCLLTVGGTTVTSNSITMTRGFYTTPEVVVTASATTICPGSSVTFTAQNKSGNPSPSWQWSVNGAPVGTNTPTFTSTTLTNGAVVVCRMTVPQCSGGSTKDDSDPITITVSQVAPTIAISTAATTVCRGTSVMFTAKTTGGGTAPSYQWKVNGVNAGSNSATFSLAPGDGDEISCILTPDASSGCVVAGGITSNLIKMKVTDGKPTTIAIAASDNNVCGSTPVTFTATVENAGATPSYQWSVNGVNVGTNSPVYTAANWKDGDKVICALSAQNTPCALSSVQLSNVITLAVKPVPVVEIDPAEVMVAAGASVQLSAKIQGAYTSYSWTPASGLVDAQSLQPVTTPMQRNTTYQLQVVADNGCILTKEAVVKVVTKLYMPNSFSPNGDGSNDVFRIPPGANIDLKELAVFDRWGNRVFRTTDAAKGWDGRYKGEPVNTGIYVYTLSGSDDKGKVFVRGTVVLVR